MLVSNVMPIVFRQVVKNSANSVSVTVSHVSRIASFGEIFGQTVVDILDEINCLTFNMYLLGIIMFSIVILMLLIMSDKQLKEKY